MARIKPFRALRPSEKSAHLVASVPYDVVNREEAKELAGNNPISFLRVSRSEIEIDDSVNPYSEEVYKRAKENLEKLKKEVPLITEDGPHFYLYRLIMDGRAQTGITAVFSIDDYDNDVILKHEKTRREKEDDRTNHIITTEAQTGVVFLTYKGVKKIDELVIKTINTLRPIYDFKASDDIQHTIWIVPEKDNEVIINEIGNVKNLYIADGHHRAASASRARKVKQEKNPEHSGEEEYNFFIGVLFPSEQLKILPYNRVVFSLNGLSEIEFLNKLKENFIVENTSRKEPVEKQTFGIYIRGKWFLIKAKDSVLKSSSFSGSVSGTLDVSILQEFVLRPVLGIEDIRTSKNIDFVGGIRGTKELEKIVDSGKAAAAFSLYPVSVDDLMRISDAGEIMPPKSTWFEPKLRDGLLIHLI